MPRQPSRADHQLIADLSDRGITVSPRQLERWRQSGLIWTERSRGTGIGGSISRYSDDAADRVEAILKALQNIRTLDNIALWMFGSGWTLPEETLRTAYRTAYDVLMEFGSAADDLDEYDRAERIAATQRARRHPVAVEWRRRLREMPDRKESVQRESWNVRTSVLHTLQTGDEVSEDAARSIAHAAGAPQIGDELPADFATTLASMSFPALAAAVQDATVEQLHQARDDMRVFAALASDGIRRWDPWTIAITAPCAIELRRIAGSALDTILPMNITE